MMRKIRQVSIGRRRFVQAAISMGAALRINRSFAGERPIRIGYVSPQTGALAAFGETDAFVIAGIRSALAGGLQVHGRRIPVEIIVRDSQSSASRAAEVASGLIERDEVQLMLVTATPDTTNPVADQCELAGVPCASTAAPWEAWFFGRGGKPDKPFLYTFHHFFGMADAIATYASIWKRLPTNHTVGGLFPNDADGAAWSDRMRGLPFQLPKAGFKLVNPGSFTNNTDNFSAHIGAFKSAGAEIVTGVLNPPDWNTFWKQARQQGFKPKVATIAKALVFPAAVTTLGKLADGLTTEVVWSPFHPFRSTLTGQSAKQLADAWTAKSAKPWTPPLGWTHSVFEVGINALRQAADPFDREAVAHSLAATHLETIFGHVDYSKGPVRNVAVTPAVGGQWRLGGPFGHELMVVANDTLPSVPIGATLRPIPY